MLCFYGAKRLTIHRIASAQVRVVPFLLEDDSYNFDEKAEGELFLKKVTARRSDGAVAEISTVGPVSLGKTIRKVRYPDGTSVDFFDLIAAKTSWRMTSPQLGGLKEHLQNPPPNCVHETEGSPKVIGEDIILEQRVLVVQANLSMGRMTQWKAPDLDCQTLRMRFEALQPDGSLKLKAEGRPAALAIGEPPATMFDSGKNYRELKPSEAQSEYLQRTGVPEDEETKSSVQPLDQKYSKQSR